LIAYFLGNISAKNYCNRTVYDKDYSKSKVGRFLRHSVYILGWRYISFSPNLLQFSFLCQYVSVDTTRCELLSLTRADWRISTPPRSPWGARREGSRDTMSPSAWLVVGRDGTYSADGDCKIKEQLQSRDLHHWMPMSGWQDNFDQLNYSP